MSRTDTPKLQKRYSDSERDPPKTSRRVTAMRRSSLIAAKQSIDASSRIVESWKAALDDFEEVEKPQKDPYDVLGQYISRHLNRNPHFRAPRPTADKSPSFQPLFSARNWRWLQEQWELVRTPTSDPRKSMETISRRLWTYLFGNAKPIHGGLLMLSGLSFVSVTCMAVAITVTSMWTLRFLWVVSMVAVSVLVDLKELKQLLPKPCQSFADMLIPAMVRFDRNVLHGKRFHGREWNRNSFEQIDCKSAQSFQQYLWKLPPPTVKEGKNQCVDERHLARDEWSEDTTKHIVAIDFCYLMIREEFLGKQYTKLRKTVFKKKKPVEPPTQQDANDQQLPQANGHSHPPADLECIEDSTEPPIDTILDEDEMGEIELSSSTLEALESRFNGNNVDFARLNGILEDEESHTSVSKITGSDGTQETNSDATTDLNWMDVGAEIGMKLLGSAAVQKAMTSHDTAERIVTIREQMGNKLGSRNSKELLADGEATENCPSANQKPAPVAVPPVHAMWTSASAAAQNAVVSPTNTIESGFSEDLTSRNVQILDRRQLVPSRSLEQSLPPPNGQQSRAPPDSMDEDIRHSMSLPRHYDLPMVSDRDIVRPPRQRTKNRGVMAEAIEVVPKHRRETSSTASKNVIRRPPLLPGVKIAVPVFPLQPGFKPRKPVHDGLFQMATVVSSQRISLPLSETLPPPRRRETNCLSVTVLLDKSFLRNGAFSQLTLRILDEWGPRYMPKHSKLPLGSCVATSFGLGVLVGWRVEDDCHVVRSLWQRRGVGSACAYLRRDQILCTMEAAIGFSVETTVGWGQVVSFVGGERDPKSGRYVVQIKEEGRHMGKTLEFNRTDIISCKSAQFIPVIEHIREAVQYQLQVDQYTATLQEHGSDSSQEPTGRNSWRMLSKYSDILWKSFLRATDEDEEFDEGMNDFIASIIRFFDRLDAPEGTNDVAQEENGIVITATDSTHSSKRGAPEATEPNFYFVNDVFGIFGANADDDMDKTGNESIEVERETEEQREGKLSGKTYDRAFAVIRTLMRTVSIAKAGCTDEPNFKLALSICYEFLIFVKTLVKVQQKNVSPHSLKVWRRAWEEIVSTFGPVKDRLKKIGQGMAERMEKQGRRAKVRLLRLADNVVQDDVLLASIEQGDWDRCGHQLELAMVKAKIIDEESREHYHKTAQFVYNHFANVTSNSSGAAARNNQKLQNFKLALQWMAFPRRSALKLLIEDNVLDTLERILVRVFHKEEIASRMLSIHASNFHTIRQFRLLKDFTIAGKFWMPLLDAADAEFSWLASKMPESAKEFMCPLSSLFSLCVLQFHKISEGDLTKDWLDFLLEEEAVEIVHEIDMKLILALEAFSRDVKEMMVVLPYYPSIEDDILNLVDEMDIDEFLKEASEAVEDPEKLSEFIREKSTIAIERFLDYLPKMSIPVEKRDLADGWVLTCRGADGGDLTLTDLSIKRENLTCQVMGGDTLFFPMLGNEEAEVKSDCSVSLSTSIDAPRDHSNTEVSILDQIREMLLNAQRHGCWEEGVGGVDHPPSDRYVASFLHGIPVSSVLNCGIELWRNLEIDDDELLEIAIRDVSYQIQLQQQREEDGETLEVPKDPPPPPTPQPMPRKRPNISEPTVHRFNPRVDPSVLYLEIQKLTFHLDKFLFRIEKHESRRTIFDPVFEGSGSLLVRNVSIKLRVECVKQYTQESGRQVPVPVLQVRELDVTLEKVKLKVKGTGADWLLNRVVKSFEANITEILTTNLNEQVRQQMDLAIENINSYFAVNPDIMLGLLDITIDDLEEKVVWV